MLIERSNISGQFSEPAFLDPDLFGALSPAAQEALRAVKRAKDFAAGANVFTKGEIPSAIYILVRGEAQIVRHGGGAAVCPATPGEIFGLTETLSNLPYETSLKTGAPCRFEYIRRAPFLNFLRNEPAACFRLLEIAAANLQQLYRFLR